MANTVSNISEQAYVVEKDLIGSIQLIVGRVNIGHRRVDVECPTSELKTVVGAVKAKDALCQFLKGLKRPMALLRQKYAVDTTVETKNRFQCLKNHKGIGCFSEQPGQWPARPTWRRAYAEGVARCVLGSRRMKIIRKPTPYAWYTKKHHKVHFDITRLQPNSVEWEFMDTARMRPWVNEIPEHVLIDDAIRQARFEWRELRDATREAAERRAEEALEDIWTLQFQPEGKTQAWFFPDRVETFNEFIVRFPDLRALLACVEAEKPDLNIAQMIIQGGFFFTHLAQAGWTKMALVTGLMQLCSLMPIKGLYNKIKDIVGRLTNTQGPETVLNTIAVALSSLIALSSVVLFNKLPSDRSIDTFITRFSRVGHMITSVDKLMEKSEMLSKLVINFIRKTFLGVDENDLNEWHRVDAWCDKVEKIRNTKLETTVVEDPVFSVHVDALLDEQGKIQKILDGLKVDARCRVRFQSLSMFLMNVREKTATGNAARLKARVPPLGIHVYGTTGCGKSTMLDYLTANLLVALGHRDPNSLVDKVYYRQAGSKHWNGFTNGCEIVIYDDFGTVRDSPGNPSVEAQEAIHVLNVAPFKPEMADLSGKASADFAAKAVVWTSNVATFTFPSLTNPEAVINRIDLKFCQRPHPDYTVPKMVGNTQVPSLDYEKIGREAKEDPSVYRRCLQFQQMHPTAATEQPIGDPISFDEFVAICRTALRNKVARGKDQLSVRKAYFEELVANIQAPPARKDVKVFGCDGVELAMTEEMYERLRRIPDVEKKLFTEKVNGNNVEYHITLTPEMEQLVLVDTPKVNDPWAPKPDEIEETKSVIHNFKLEYFQQVPWWQKWMGATDHINVPATVVMTLKNNRDLIDLATKLRGEQLNKCMQNIGTPMFKVSQLFLSRCCLKMPDCDKERFATELATAYVHHLYGSYDQYDDSWWNSFDACLMCCNLHEDVGAHERAETLIANITQRSLSECANYMVRTCDESRSTLSTILRSLLFGVGVTVAFSAVAFGIRMIIESIKKIFWGVSAATYALVRVTANIKGGAVEGTPVPFDTQFEPDSVLLAPSAKAEQYGDGSLVAIRAKTVENYAAGATKMAPQRTVETYSNGPVKSTNRTVESYADGTPLVRPVKTVENYASGTPVTQQQRTVEGGLFERLSSAFGFSDNGCVEATLDQNASEIRQRLYRNMFSIATSSDGRNWRVLGTTTFVQGRLALTNRHIVDLMDEYVQIKNEEQEFDFRWDDITVVTIDDDAHSYGKKDCSLLEFPRSVPCRSSIHKFFMTNEDFGRHTTLGNVMMVGYSPGRHPNSKVPYVSYSNMCVARDQEDFKLVDYEGKVRYIRQFYAYNIQSEAGDCGSLMLATDPMYPRKIFAMHMAGVTSTGPFNGAGTAITQEYLEVLYAEMRKKCKFQDSFLDNTVRVDIPMEVEITPEGALRPTSTFLEGTMLQGRAFTKVHGSIKTSIQRSNVAHLCGPIYKKPAHLTKFRNEEGVEIDPRALALKKVCLPPVSVNTDDLNDAANDVKQMICANIKSSDQRVLTFAEGITGIAGDDAYPPINRSTSCGYGWPKGRGKHAFLGDDDYVLNHPMLLAKYAEACERLESGQRIGSYWTDTMKDELRPIEKVDQGKTRLFSAGEMVQTILLRQYFCGFTAHMARNVIDVEACIGLNPFGMHWNKLANRMQELGPNVVAGDFTNYDGTLAPQILWAVLDIVNAFYAQDRMETPELDRETQYRRQMWLDIVNSTHISGDNVYMWTHGQPSGCPFTSVLNSVYHSIAVRMAYLHAARKYSPIDANMQRFNELCRHVNYGDDDITNVSLQAPWFDQVSMAEGYETFGMTYTDFTKGSELVRYRKLEDIEYLKRSFRWDRQQTRWRAPLNLATIMEMPCWNKTRSASQDELTSLVLRAAVYELAQHSEEVWNGHIGQLDAARRAIYMTAPTCFLTYSAYNRMDALKVYSDVTTANAVIGALRQSSHDEEQQILLASTMSLSGDTQSRVGGVFTPSGKCVPTKNNKLFARRADGIEMSHPPVEGNRLANTTQPNEFCLFCSEKQACQSCIDLAKRTPDEKRDSQRVRRYLEYHEKLTTLPGEQQFDLTLFRRGMNTMIQRWASFANLYTYKTWKPHDINMYQAQLSAIKLMYALGNLWDRPIEPSMDSLPELWTEIEYLVFRCVTFIREGRSTRRFNQRALDDTGRSMERFANSLKNLVSTAYIISQMGEDEVDTMTGTTEATAPDHTDKHETMQFVEDGEVEQAERQGNLGEDAALLTVAHDNLTNDIIGFLQRPVLMNNFTWKSTDPLGSTFGTTTLPRDWLQIPMIKEKVFGFRYLRCTLVVQVQVNAQPFNAGAFLMYFRPLFNQLAFVTTGESHFGGVYGYPHVIYRCGEATSVQLEVPYFPVLSAFDLITGYGTMGAVQCKVLSKLTGSADVDGTIWVWAKDVQLEVPTGLTGVTQSSAPQGVVSRVVASVASAARAMISTRDESSTGRVNPVYANGMTNADLPTQSKMLALSSKNCTEAPAGVFDTDRDEMNFATIVEKPVYCDSFKFDATKTQSSVLWSWPVDATSCVRTYVNTDDVKTVFPLGAYQYQETYISYLSKFAQFWRGELKYHFMVVKTPFHSGRLRVTFVPGADEATKFTGIDLNKCYSKVVDLRERVDFDADIPFTFNQLWKPTEMTGYEAKINAGYKCKVPPTGMLYVSVLNALRAPSTVEQSIEVIVTVSAGKDFQFAVPFMNPHVRVLENNKNAFPLASSQMVGLTQSMRPATVSDSERSRIYEGAETTLDVNKVTIGENYTGFQQLLSRYVPMPTGGWFNPFLSTTRRLGKDGYTPSLVEELSEVVSPYRGAAVLYRFACGNLRVMFKTAEGQLTGKKFGVSLATGCEQNRVPVLGVETPVGHPLVLNTFMEQLPEVEVPFYQPWNALPTDLGSPHWSEPDFPADTVAYGQMPYNEGSRLSTEGPSPVGSFRAIAENFRFGYLVGVPLTVVGVLGVHRQL